MILNVMILNGPAGEYRLVRRGIRWQVFMFTDSGFIFKKHINILRGESKVALYRRVTDWYYQ